MRHLLLLVAACGSAGRPAAEPVPTVTPRPAPTAPTCAEAAVGLERATRSVRPPESSVVQDMKQRCTDDAWPEPARTCFARMAEGELGPCAVKLDDSARKAMFLALGAAGSDRTTIAIVRARLQTLQVGVAECDRFIGAVAAVMTCEGLPVEVRARLGSETAEFWDLPTHDLRPEAHQRMAQVCGTSLAELQQQASGVGCTP